MVIEAARAKRLERRNRKYLAPWSAPLHAATPEPPASEWSPPHLSEQPPRLRDSALVAAGDMSLERGRVLFRIFELSCLQRHVSESDLGLGSAVFVAAATEAEAEAFEKRTLGGCVVLAQEVQLTDLCSDWGTRTVQPSEGHGVVLVVATKGGDQHIDVGCHSSAASTRDLLLRPSMPFRDPPLRRERGSGSN